jgi:hypothetical protein
MIKLNIQKLYKFEDFINNDKYNYFIFSIDLNKSWLFKTNNNYNFIECEDKQLIDLINLPMLYKIDYNNLNEYKLHHTSRTIKLSKAEIILFMKKDNYDNGTKERMKFNLIEYLLKLNNTTLYNIIDSENNIIKDSFDIKNNDFIVQTYYTINDFYRIFNNLSDSTNIITKYFKYNIK